MPNNLKQIYTIFELDDFRYKLIADEESLLSLEIEKLKETNLRLSVGSKVKNNPMRFNEIRMQLESYLAGELKSFDIPLNIEKLKGTQFQKEVWQSLLEIPYGSTCSYKELSEGVNRPKAHRAVGSANGKNPIPIIIPCHRVVAHNGGLGGYALGLEFKKKLLGLEASESLLI